MHLDSRTRCCRRHIAAAENVRFRCCETLPSRRECFARHQPTRGSLTRNRIGIDFFVRVFTFCFKVIMCPWTPYTLHLLRNDFFCVYWIEINREGRLILGITPRRLLKGGQQCLLIHVSQARLPTFFIGPFLLPRCFSRSSCCSRTRPMPRPS